MQSKEVAVGKDAGQPEKSTRRRMILPCMKGCRQGVRNNPVDTLMMNGRKRGEKTRSRHSTRN